MEKKLLCSLILIFTLSCTIYAQLEKVIVETYYISDDSDATDTTGSVLKAHSTTYRIYIDMAPGYKLTKIFGNTDHQLSISSDSVFYNHTTNGQSFARNFNIKRFSEGTTALDTWLTLGQISAAKPTGKTYYGVLKPGDRDGSIIGGANNDGGSNAVPGGLLINNDPLAGNSLTDKDGLDTMAASMIPSGWLDAGIVDGFGNDSTIFGSLKLGKQFISNSAFLQNSGIIGVNRDSNQVLLAQLTTRGKLRFALNVEIIDSKGTVYDYVAKNGADSLTANVIQSPYLNYPLPCGCIDPNYLEYNPVFGCMDSTACKTPVVLGCTDPLACNYDPTANFNVQSLCCYPGLCDNRDISLVCPNLSVNELHNSIRFDISPNPVQENLNLTITTSNSKEIVYEIVDAFGRLISKKNIGIISATNSIQVDVSEMAAGLYILRLLQDEASGFKKFVKN